MIKRKNALKYVFVLFIVFSLLFTYLSFKINNRNPYFDHLSQSERSAICSATPEDLAKLYFESLHEKNYDLCLAPAPSSINVTRFVVLKPSFLYKCFLIDGIGTSP